MKKEKLYSLVQIYHAKKRRTLKRFKRNFLDLYLKEIPLNENKEISIDEIINNFCALFLAGIDKIENMTGVSLYYLTQNPKIQEEARDEVINILKSIIQSQNPQDLIQALTFEDLSQMLLVHSILKESLRLIPPAAAILGRYANKDIEICEFYVKKGDLVNTNFIQKKLYWKAFSYCRKMHSCKLFAKITTFCLILVQDLIKRQKYLRFLSRQFSLL